MRRSTLMQVTFVGRHSVRAPLPGELEYVEPFVTQPWPEWEVGPAQLSPHGRLICRHLGRWWREFYGPRLFGADRPTDWIHLRADSLQRDVDTAAQWLRGFLGEEAGQLEVHHDEVSGEDCYDPLFMPVAAGMVKVTGVRESVLGRMGGSLDNAIESIHRPLSLIQRVFGTAIRQPELYGAENAVLDDGTILGTLYIAQIASDMFIMQRANGWPLYQVAWGRIDQADLLDIARTRAFVDNLLMRSPTYARAQASNLLVHVLAGMEQRVSGREVPGMPFGPGHRLVGYFGHDTNVEAIGGLLGVSWIPRGWVQFQSPPAGKLIFELHRDIDTGEFFVRLFFLALTMEQMASGAPVSLAWPPCRAPISLGDHRLLRTSFDVPFEAFRAIVRMLADPHAVSDDLAGWFAGLSAPVRPVSS